MRAAQKPLTGTQLGMSQPCPAKAGVPLYSQHQPDEPSQLTSPSHTATTNNNRGSCRTTAGRGGGL